MVVPITDVQSEQLRLLQAHGLLTTPRMAHILDYDAESLRWVADHWQVSTTAEANAEVRRWRPRRTPLCRQPPSRPGSLTGSKGTPRPVEIFDRTRMPLAAESGVS